MTISEKKALRLSESHYDVIPEEEITSQKHLGAKVTHYVKVPVLIKFSQKTSVFTLIIVRSL